MAEEIFKNISVLRGIPVDEFMDTMGMISAALGLNCLDCHTSDADKSWERFGADTTMKNTARRIFHRGVGAEPFPAFVGIRRMTVQAVQAQCRRDHTHCVHELVDRNSSQNRNIFEDLFGHLWFGCLRGLSRLPARGRR